LRRLAAFMVPANAEYGVPGADDRAIFAEIGSFPGPRQRRGPHGTDMLREIAGGDFVGLGEVEAEAAAMMLLSGKAGADGTRRAVLQCYYRDDA